MNSEVSGPNGTVENIGDAGNFPFQNPAAEYPASTLPDETASKISKGPTSSFGPKILNFKDPPLASVAFSVKYFIFSPRIGTFSGYVDVIFKNCGFTAELSEEFWFEFEPPWLPPQPELSNVNPMAEIDNMR